MQKFYVQLKPREINDIQGRKPGSYKWYEIQDNVAYYKDFEKEKAIWLELTNSPNFYVDSEGYFVNNTIFIMTGNDIKYVTAFLNTVICKWYFDTIAATSGAGTRRWIKIYVEQIKIPKVCDDDKQKIADYVSKIQLGKLKGRDTSTLEALIEEYFYGAFGFNAEERNAIGNLV